MNTMNAGRLALALLLGLAACDVERSVGSVAEPEAAGEPVCDPCAVSVEPLSFDSRDGLARVRALAEAPDGTVIAVGQLDPYQTSAGFVARLDPGSAQLVTTRVPFALYDVDVSPQGRLVVAGDHGQRGVVGWAKSVSSALTFTMVDGSKRSTLRAVAWASEKEAYIGGSRHGSPVVDDDGLLLARMRMDGEMSVLPPPPPSCPDDIKGDGNVDRTEDTVLDIATATDGSVTFVGRKRDEAFGELQQWYARYDSDGELLTTPLVYAPHGELSSVAIVAKQPLAVGRTREASGIMAIRYDDPSSGQHWPRDPGWYSAIDASSWGSGLSVVRLDDGSTQLHDIVHSRPRDEAFVLDIPSTTHVEAIEILASGELIVAGWRVGERAPLTAWIASVPDLAGLVAE